MRTSRFALPALLLLSLACGGGSSSSSSTTPSVTPGTPQAPPGGLLPVGGTGSNRWQIGASGGGLYLADPAAGEAAIQGLVIVNLDQTLPPADTQVTLNGVPMVPAPPSDSRFFKVDPNGPQPQAAPGGQLVIVASSASAGVKRQLVLPVAQDQVIVTNPAAGASLAGSSGLLLSFGADLTLNPPGILALAGVTPTATLEGYDPATRTLTPATATLIGAGQLTLTVPVGSTPAPAWMLDVRWPGLFIPDGNETGAFCGLAKRFTYTR